MKSEINPWLTMWANPRNTIRTIVNADPKYGMIYLASLYALQNVFYLSNYWSLGLSAPFHTILVGGLVLCPFTGLAWVYVAGWILHFTGRWLHGKAPISHLRAAFIWSKLPTSINLALWLVLLVAYPESAFIQDATSPSALFISFIFLVVAIWSLTLLIQSVREVQGFSVLRSIINVVLAWFFSSILFFLLFALLRFIYIRFLF